MYRDSWTVSCIAISHLFWISVGVQSNRKNVGQLNLRQRDTSWVCMVAVVIQVEGRSKYKVKIGIDIFSDLLCTSSDG